MVRGCGAKTKMKVCNEAAMGSSRRGRMQQGERAQQGPG